MTTIMRRELRSFFTSPNGYVFLIAFSFFAGFFFVSSLTTDLSYVFSSLFTVILFLVPILTMRLFSEDKKYKTDQALLTAPVSLTGIVLGKFFAAVILYALALAITLVFGIVINFFVVPSWGMIFGNYLATLLLGMALISIGMLISCLTESQLVAAIGGFGVAFVLVILSYLSSLVGPGNWSVILSAISFEQPYTSFQNGLFSLSSVIFFLTASTLFLFVTVRILERKRWS